VIQRADALGISPEEPTAFTYLPGRGVMARMGAEEVLVGSRAFLQNSGIVDCPTSAVDLATAATEVLVARQGRYLGAILIADTVRPESSHAIRILRGLGIRTVLLTGDARHVAEAVGRTLHVDEVHSELLPDQKVAVVRQLSAAGRTVAMVGDGINDAPALVQAAVGVAMGSGTDVARESADIVLLGNDLSKFAETVQIARRAKAIIRFNFAGTLVVDAVGVGLAAFGLLNPLVAAFIHVSSELAFILNSARLLPRAPRRRVTVAAPLPRLTGATTA
jgi:Cu+-exporting ATPase